MGTSITTSITTVGHWQICLHCWFALLCLLIGIQTLLLNTGWSTSIRQTFQVLNIYDSILECFYATFIEGSRDIGIIDSWTCSFFKTCYQTASIECLTLKVKEGSVFKTFSAKQKFEVSHFPYNVQIYNAFPTKKCAKFGLTGP